jgi:Ca2+-transporting ATPase
MVYMSTIVEDGRGIAIVTETGMQPEIGKIAKIIKETEEEKTPYQQKIVHLSKIIGFVIAFVSFLIFLAGAIMGRDVLEMFLTAIAIAVAAIPEGLPVSITVILALGMQRILQRNGLIRRVIAAETLGSTSVILTDKTGTLTEGKMEVAGVFTGHKELLSDGRKYSEEIDLDGQASHLLALKIATLCSEAFIENPEDALEE